jgi:hypothetical protein
MSPVMRYIQSFCFVCLSDNALSVLFVYLIMQGGKAEFFMIVYACNVAWHCSSMVAIPGVSLHQLLLKVFNDDFFNTHQGDLL